MAINYSNVGTRVSSAGATSATPALPTRANGNLLIAICGTKNNAVHSTSTNGWVKLDQRNSGTGWTMSVFWRMVDGAEAAPVITWTGSVANFAIQYVFSGNIDSVAPIGNFLSNAGTTSPHTNAGTTATRNTSQFIYLGAAAANTAYGTTTSWTERQDTGSNTGATRQVVGTINATLNNGQSSGSTSSTGAAAAWVMYQIELREPPTFSINGESTLSSFSSSGTAENVAPSNDRNISGSASLQSISGSGTATRTVPQFNISGSASLQPISGAGNATRTLPVFSINGGATLQPIESVGNATRTVPVFSINGGAILQPFQTAGIIDYTEPGRVISGSSTLQPIAGSGAIQFVTPQFQINGSSSLSPIQASGVANRTVPQYNVSGGATISKFSGSGVAVRTVPVFSISGSASLSPIEADGVIANVVPQFNISGGASLQPVSSSGNAISGGPVFEISGASTLQSISGSGQAERTVPVFQVSGSSTLPKIGSAGAIDYEPPARTISGGSTLAKLFSSGSISSAGPVFNINGSAVLQTVEGLGNIQLSIPDNDIIGASSILSISASGSIDVENPGINISGASSLKPISSLGASSFSEAVSRSFKPIPVGFRILIPEPVEVKMVSYSIAERNSIPEFERYKGLFTYSVQDDTFYYLSEGITNEHWKAIGKPQAVIILDEFTDDPQKIISGYGLKTYLEANYYTKSQVDSLLAGVQIPAHIASITEAEVQKLKTIQGDISQRIDFNDPKSVWVVQHPAGKSIEAFNALGIKIIGREKNISETITAIGWSKPLSGYVKIN